MPTNNHSFPLTQCELAKAIAAETARMSFPTSMSRGIKPIVRKGTKGVVEEYFVTSFPILKLKESRNTGVNKFERWHHKCVEELSCRIKKHVASGNIPESVAAKFLNTFLHQLMKYEWARPIFSKLHLPLDSKVFKKLRRIDSDELSLISDICKQSPYSLSYDKHIQVQEALNRYIKELNARPNCEFKIASRVELNLLWV